LPGDAEESGLRTATAMASLGPACVAWLFRDVQIGRPRLLLGGPSLCRRLLRFRRPSPWQVFHGRASSHRLGFALSDPGEQSLRSGAKRSSKTENRRLRAVGFSFACQVINPADALGIVGEQERGDQFSADEQRDRACRGNGNRGSRHAQCSSRIGGYSGPLLRVAVGSGWVRSSYATAGAFAGASGGRCRGVSLRVSGSPVGRVAQCFAVSICGRTQKNRHQTWNRSCRNPCDIKRVRRRCQEALTTVQFFAVPVAFMLHGAAVGGANW
jgi:hypothetical protein